MIEKISERITKTQIKFPKTYIIVFVIISLLLIPGIFNLINNVEPSLEKVLPSNIPEIQTMNNMRSEFGADMMYLLVYVDSPLNDARNPSLIKYIDTLSEKLRSQEHILEVNNIADIVKFNNNGVIPDSLNDIKEIISGSQQAMNFLNHDFTFSLIRLRTDTGAESEKIKEVIDGVNYDIQGLESINPGSNIKITGFSAIDKATFEVIMSDFAFITLVSMILVAVVVFFTFKSLSKGLLPMIVVVVALIWTMGITGYLGLTITVVSMVAAAMIMGLGIDFGIHVVHNYFELRKNHDSNYSIIETMKELLRAMIGASLTTIAGFLALLFGVLPAMKNLGIILAIGIFSTMVAAVLLLPVIVYLYDHKENKASNALK